jgi:hypothetical protein
MLGGGRGYNHEATALGAADVDQSPGAFAQRQEGANNVCVQRVGETLRGLVDRRRAWRDSGAGDRRIDSPKPRGRRFVGRGD